jgi:hypothetical protein
MSIAGLSTQTQSSDLSLISGTSQSSQTTSVNQVVSQGPEAADKAQFSQGGQMMNQLKQLQTSDPAKFKAAAQNISDQLAEKAKDATNSQEKTMYTKMAGDFAEAAKTGQMPTPPSKPEQSGGAENSQPGAQKFNAQVGHGDFMNTMSSIISGALSSVGASTSAASSSSTATAASTSVAAVASSAA